MTRIDFQDSRWGQVEGVKLCDTGNNTLTDTQTGTEFIIGEGSMQILNPPNRKRFLFFTPKGCNGNPGSIARLVIRFTTPQQYVRCKLSPKRSDITVNFYREHGATDLRESRSVPTNYPQLNEVVYNSTEAIKELTITSQGPENLFYALEFYESFADIKHDIALALDGSGSMSTQDKWGAMVEAADLFHDLYSELGDSSEGFGAVRFRWDCADTVGGDETTAQPPLDPLSTGIDIPSIYENDSPDGCTPIGEGAVQAANMVAGGSNPSNHLLLLTDGKNNRGRTVPNASRARALDEVTVHTLGLGSGVHIDSNEINTLAADHGGQFRQTTDPDELLDFFAETLGDMTGKVEIAATSGATATVAPGTGTAVFLIAWDDPAMNKDFDLIAPDGTTVDHANPPNLQNITVSYNPSTNRSAHAYFVVEGDIQGDWQFQNTPSGAETIALEDLDLRIQWSVTPQLGLTGDPIALVARVTYQGEPYEGDVTVTADVSRPDEAKGDILAEALQADPVSVTPKGDTSQRGRIISTVLEREGREAFRRSATPDLTFEADEEGVYRLQYTDTDYEGVYRFDLRAEGTDEAGDTVFARRATRFCTLMPAIDGGRTTTSIDPVDDDVYSVDITPRTVDGNFAGPFLADQLTVRSGQGTAVTDLDDNHDGTYTQLVQTDGAPPEDVSIDVRGRTVPVERPTDDEETKDWLPWLLVLVLLVLVVVLLVLLLS